VPTCEDRGSRFGRLARRLAYNRHLGGAVKRWAFCSLSQSAWAREFHSAQIPADPRKRVLYDETTHAANRARTRSIKLAA